MLDALIANPLVSLVLFLAASFLMIWRLEVMASSGYEGTALGTLIAPYCSGLGNLLFVYLMIRDRGPSEEVAVNCIVNNATNLTLLIGIPLAIWSLSTRPAESRQSKGKAAKKQRQQYQITRLQLTMTLVAGLFFTGATWALGKDGVLDMGDGLVLTGLFLFWQAVNVFDVLKTNIKDNKSPEGFLILELCLLGAAAYGIYVSLNNIVDWLQAQEAGFFSADKLGWITGWLMVLPNALLAVYYGWRRQIGVVYTSQVGDGHICIPLCLGIYAIFTPMQIPELFNHGMLIIGCGLVLHLIFAGFLAYTPRWLGYGLLASYGVFLWYGM